MTVIGQFLIIFPRVAVSDLDIFRILYRWAGTNQIFPFQGP